MNTLMVATGRTAHRWAHEPPAHWPRLWVDGQRLGVLAPLHAQCLLQRDLTAGAVRVTPQGADLALETGAATPAARSEALQGLAERLHARGWIKGWRGEVFRLEADQGTAGMLDQPGPEWAQLERAAFRFFGFRSRAVHVHGQTADGRLWCGQRSRRKAIDPGRWDNLAAGGVPAGEDLRCTVIRELGEEAGIAPTLASQAQGLGQLRTARCEPEGWHDEVLHVYRLALPSELTPRNQDGEVQTFACWDGPTVRRLLTQNAFTQDAAAVTWAFAEQLSLAALREEAR